MRSAEEISAMWGQLDDNIREHGWDVTVEGALQALAWVLDIPPGNNGPSSLRYLADKLESGALSDAERFGVALALHDIAIAIEIASVSPVRPDEEPTT